MAAHKWKFVSGTYGARQCSICGVIRLTVCDDSTGPNYRYSRPGANSRHCNTWYMVEPSCEPPPAPVTVTVRRATP